MNQMIKLCLVTVGLLMGWTHSHAEGPGGYIGFGLHFGTDKTVGAQVSYGVALTSVGEPGVGPYLFPGVAMGTRYSFLHKTSYSYSDLQLTYFNGAWAGIGFGPTFSKLGTSLKGKVYGGFLAAGLCYEKSIMLEKDVNITFLGGYLGLAVPLIGSHLMP